jgi:hypothetical protein
MTDKLEFLEQTEAEPVADQTPDPAPEPVLTGETQDAGPPPAAEDKDQRIPITALLDEREKRQQFAREAEEARREVERLRQQLTASQPQQKAPDWFEKPDEAIRHHIAPIAQQVLSVKLEQSRFLAERDFGAETVAEAFEFFNQNPQLSHQLLNNPSPFHAAVDFYKRQKVMSQIEGDPEAWINAQVEARLQERLANVQPSPAKTAAPPPSLARAPAAGSGESMKPGSAFDALPIR